MYYFELLRGESQEHADSNQYCTFWYVFFHELLTYVIPARAEFVCSWLGVVDVLKTPQQWDEGGRQQAAAHSVVIVMVTATKNMFRENSKQSQAPPY